MGCVVPRGSLLVKGQFSLDPIKIVLTDQRWNGGDQRPCLRGCGILTVGGFPQRMRGGTPETRWPRLGATAREFSCIGGIGQESMQGRGTPARITSRRLDAQLE